MRISDVMTRDVQTVSPNADLREAARLMDELNVGSLPVCDGSRLVGMITDRDITVRATAAGIAPANCQVSQAMTDEVRYCREDNTVAEVAETMSNVQIRRLPVIDNDRNLIGIVSLGDLAVRDPADASRTLQGVSEPAQPDR